jgi:hypothetical protein
MNTLANFRLPRGGAERRQAYASTNVRKTLDTTDQISRMPMNSRRCSSDELEATALFADHDVEEPIELDIHHLLRAHSRRLSQLLNGQRECLLVSLRSL